MLYVKCDELSYRTMGAQQSIDETFPSHTVQEIPYKLFQYISFFFNKQIPEQAPVNILFRFK